MIDGKLSLKLRGGGAFGLTGRTCAGVRVDDVMTQWCLSEGLRLFAGHRHFYSEEKLQVCLNE